MCQPQTSSATSTTSRSLASSSSTVSALPSTVEENPHCGVRVLDELLSECTPMRLGVGRFRAALKVPPLLNSGEYTVGLWFGTEHEDFLDQPAAAAPFVVHGGDANRSQRLLALRLPFDVKRFQG